jgi:hypothetical protein
MKNLITLLILTIGSFGSFAQQYSAEIDRTTREYIGKLPKEQQHFFDSILAQRQSVDWFSRIDSIPYDYAFIEEIFVNRYAICGVTERYFADGDTIPKFIFSVGKPLDPKEVYTNFLGWWTKNVTYQQTLYPKIAAFETYKPTQELAYDKRQIWSHGCVTSEQDKDDFTKRCAEELKTTWQIVTMIDKKNNKVIVSVQTAPVNPRFEVYSYNGVWDW